MSDLAKIRQSIIDRTKPGTKKCPKCAHILTIEVTKFFQTELCENCLEHAEIIDLSEGRCCEKPELHFVKLITAANSIQVRNQCKNCGGVRPQSLGGFTKEERESLPLVDQSARDNRYNEQSTGSRRFWESIRVRKNDRFEVERQQRQALYHEYLATPEWGKKRDAVLKRDEYKCQACLENYATQVHHKSYQFVDLKGNEPAFDLVAICVPCHEKIEKMKREGRQ